MEWINEISTLDLVMQSPPNWELLYESAAHKINGHAEKYSTTPLPFEPSKPKVRYTRTDCKHLTAEPFKHYAWCERRKYPEMIKQSDCAKCRFYNPVKD